MDVLFINSFGESLGLKHGRIHMFRSDGKGIAVSDTRPLRGSYTVQCGPQASWALASLLHHTLFQNWVAPLHPRQLTGLGQYTFCIGVLDLRQLILQSLFSAWSYHKWSQVAFGRHVFHTLDLRVNRQREKEGRRCKMRGRIILISWVQFFLRLPLVPLVAWTFL